MNTVESRDPSSKDAPTYAGVIPQAINDCLNDMRSRQLHFLGRHRSTTAMTPKPQNIHKG